MFRLDLVHLKGETMKNKMILLIVAFLMNCEATRAQNKTYIFKHLKDLYNNLNSLNGNLFFFKQYGALDTNYFSEPSMRESRMLIKLYSMKQVQINFDSLSHYIPSDRIKNEMNFGQIVSDKAKFSNDDLKYSAKLDSFFQSYKLRLKGTNQLPIDSFAVIENLVLTSTHINVTKQKVAEVQKKMLQIAVIYESEKLLLIIYSIYISLNNSYVDAELIIK